MQPSQNQPHQYNQENYPPNVVKKKEKKSQKGTLDRGEKTSNALRDPRLEENPTGIRARSQAMPNHREKGHLSEQTILVRYVVSTTIIITIVSISLAEEATE